MTTTTTINKIDYFIELLSLPLSVAKTVLKTDEDCQSFYINFHGRNRLVVDDLLDYREAKIENSEITLDMFLESCYHGYMKDVFENTFYQSFTVEDMILINQAIVSGEITLEYLFTDFKANPNKNILKNIL